MKVAPWVQTTAAHLVLRSAGSTAGTRVDSKAGPTAEQLESPSVGPKATRSVDCSAVQKVGHSDEPKVETTAGQRAHSSVALKAVRSELRLGSSTDSMWVASRAGR